MDFIAFPAASVIMVATVLISLFVMFVSPNLMPELMLHPYSLLKNKRYFTLITSGFIHNDIFHLMFNMFTFYFFAFSLESIVGAKQFLIIYIGSMIIADIPTVWKHRDNYGYSALGASGAISGLLFSFILYAPEVRLNMLMIPIPIPAPIFGVLYLLWCYYADKRSFGSDSGDRLVSGNISHSAHLWGAVAGIFLTIVLNPPVVAEFFTHIKTYFN